MLGLGHGGLYKQVYSDDTLTEAWRKVRTGTEMAGVDGVTVNLFQARLFANLKALQTELRKGRYAPQPVKRLSIPKADGSQRPLGILTVRDRIVQRAVLIVVEPLFEAGFEACSHGYRKGRSVQTALTQLCQFINQGYGWIVDFDIAACFETINTNRLCTFVNERLKNPELRRLVRAWLDMEAAAITRSGMWRQRQTVGILQGGTLSPLLANIAQLQHSCYEVPNSATALWSGPASACPSSGRYLPDLLRSTLFTECAFCQERRRTRQAARRVKEELRHGVQRAKCKK